MRLHIHREMTAAVFIVQNIKKKSNVCAKKATAQSDIARGQKTILDLFGKKTTAGQSDDAKQAEDVSDEDTEEYSSDDSDDTDDGNVTEQ